jgi:phosphoribosylaminoimidazole-succinocarboxamide synthase
MAKIPINRRETPLSLRLAAAGLTRINQGKVRDTWLLPGRFLDGCQLMLVIVTDRCSIFDFVLDCYVEKKGIVLNAMNIFWTEGPLRDLPTDLVAYGFGIDEHLESELHDNLEIWSRGTVVRQLPMVPREMIARGYLTGSAVPKYRETGKVCGIELPTGLHDGSRLDTPIFTPTTKALVGHDEHIDRATVVAEFGPWTEECTLLTYRKGSEYAESRGVILADTKFEFAYVNGEPILCDEKLTPDSSRFWLKSEWEKAVALKKSPPSHDKQYVRNHGLTIATPFVHPETGAPLALDKLKPENDEHVAFVHGLMIPDEVTRKTTDLYLEIFDRLTDKPLDSFLLDEMGIAA